MIAEYHRPNTLPEALALLSRSEIETRPLAGGTALDRQAVDRFAVVDLQNLGLNTLQARGNSLQLGAMLTLQNLLDSTQAHDFAAPGITEGLSKAIQHEATINLRQMATIAGTLVVAEGRSPFTTALLALDAEIIIEPGAETENLGNLLPFRSQKLEKRLITQINLPSAPRLAYEYVARTPADRPIVCAALALWPSGRARLGLGGYGIAPTLAFDGNESSHLEIAAQSAYEQAGDEKASAEYRSQIAGVLAKRCLTALENYSQ